MSVSSTKSPNQKKNYPFLAARQASLCCVYRPPSERKERERQRAEASQSRATCFMKDDNWGHRKVAIEADMWMDQTKNVRKVVYSIERSY